MNKPKIDASIYSNPEVIKAMAKVDEMATEQEGTWAVFYNPDTKAIFTGLIDNYPAGCVDIYDTEDGKLY